MTAASHELWEMIVGWMDIAKRNRPQSSKDTWREMSEQSLEVEILIEPFKGTLKDRKRSRVWEKEGFQRVASRCWPSWANEKKCLNVDHWKRRVQYSNCISQWSFKKKIIEASQKESERLSPKRSRQPTLQSSAMVSLLIRREETPNFR